MENVTLTIEQRLHRIEVALGIGDSPEAEATREEWRNMYAFMNPLSSDRQLSSLREIESATPAESR